ARSVFLYYSQRNDHNLISCPTRRSSDLAVVDRFGPAVLDGDRLDRAALGKIIFGDPQARRDLESITHPLIRRRAEELERAAPAEDRKSTRLNSSHVKISYAVFCLKKKKK